MKDYFLIMIILGLNVVCDAMNETRDGEIPSLVASCEEYPKNISLKESLEYSKECVLHAIERHLESTYVFDVQSGMKVNDLIFKQAAICIRNNDLVGLQNYTNENSEWVSRFILSCHEEQPGGQLYKFIEDLKDIAQQNNNNEVSNWLQDVRNHIVAPNN